MNARFFTAVFGGNEPPTSKLFSLNKLRRILSMPRNREYLTDLKKQRLKNKDKLSDDGAASICYLQVLGSGANGASRSLYFFTDKKRYMFNVGEGVQRTAHEHKVKIARMEHIFVTYPIWENIGGLPGLALTLQECGVPDITVHGPKGLSSIFESTKRFVVLNNLNIRSAVCENSKMFQDSCVTIEYISLVSNNLKMLIENRCSVLDFISDIESIKDDIDYYVHLKNGESAGSKRDSSVSDLSQICTNLLPASIPVAISYICTLTPKAGALDLMKCVEKRVPPGPLLGKLKAGEDITLPDGTVVKSTDVTDPDEKGPSFIVIDCPSKDFLESLSNEESFRKFQSEKPDTDTALSYVIHFTPAEIMDDDRYRAWMQKFPKETLHVNANDKNKCLGSVGVHEIQYKLNLLDSAVFPLLADDSIPIINSEGEISDADLILDSAKQINTMKNESHFLPRTALNFPDDYGNTLRILNLRPSNYVEKNVADCIHLSPKSYVNEVMKISGFAEKLQSLKTNIELLSPVIESIREQQPYPRITFLGTGSCIPNKCRNTSGILVSLSDENHLLMDCGEGTYGQIVRHFGVERATEILANLNVIFVSHLHADHHIGLISILKHRRKAVELHNAEFRKVFLLAPKTILYWLISYQQQFEELFDCLEFVANQDLEYRSKLDIVHEKILSAAPLQDIVTSYVIHCPQAFGISFTHANGCKVTYSGDTMPSKDLINIGKYSHLLIHEATFEDSLIGEAKSKYHSTTSQAIEVGEKMEAKFTLLTHFSQRYAKLPLITGVFTEKVGIAFDNMEISMSDLPKLHLFNPVLQLMFEEEIEQIVAKNMKRKRMRSD